MLTIDEFGAAIISFQLQEHHWSSKSIEDRDRARAAVDGEGKCQAPEGIP